MYGIHIYQNERGDEPIAEYISSLAEQSETNKDSRVKLYKITEYLHRLRISGKRIGEPEVKHLDGEIWELRPLRDRILFASWDRESFILLHHFMKETEKTPLREIAQAKRNLADLRKRGITYE